MEGKGGDVQMKFSLWNFKEWYERRKLDLSYMISDNTASISLLATSQAAAEGRLGCALVLPAEELTDCTGFHTVLQFGSDRILFPVASPAEVLNEGAAMMEFYTHWENALLDRITANGTVPDFIDLSREVLPFPLALLSANGAVLFQTVDWPLPLGPQQIQALFRKNQQHQPAQPYFRALPHVQPSTILAEVLNEQDIPVLLAACEDRKRFQPGDVHIFHTFAEIIQAALSFRDNALPALHPLATWLSRQLSEQDEQPPASVLAQIGWHMTDFFLIAALQPVSGALAPSRMLSVLTTSDHCCVMAGDQLCLLIHLRASELVSEETERLQVFACQEHCKVGLSLPFTGLHMLPSFYQQALLALRHAQHSGQTVQSMHTLLPQAIQQACRNLPNAQTLVHPLIRKLANADQQEDCHLLKTLYTYLIFGGSISQTADALFIHRNTLRTRLHKIQSLFPADWDTPAMREQLLLSLLFFDPDG